MPFSQAISEVAKIVVLRMGACLAVVTAFARMAASEWQYLQ